MVLTREDGSQETFPAAADQVASYAPFVRDTLHPVAAGEAPDAGLADMVETARMAERAYRLAAHRESMV